MPDGLRLKTLNDDVSRPIARAASLQPRRARSRPLAPRVLALLLAVGMAVSPLPSTAQVRLPSLGDSSTQEFTVNLERRYGEQIMREIARDPDYLDDPVLLEYLQGLWQPLVAAARRGGDVEPDVDKSFAWDVFLVRERSVNAFALPGGWVGVHLGLISLTATGDELASVLAHELSHVSQRHIARSIVNAQRQSLVSVAGVLLAMVAASRNASPDAVQAAVVGGQAAAIQGQLNFSREMEREADRIGFSVLRGAGFEVAGMAAMFEKLDSANRLNDSGSFPYLRTHPLTVERMAEARSRVLLGGGGDAASPWLHAMMRGRARVLMDGNPQALQRLWKGGVGDAGAPPAPPAPPVVLSQPAPASPSASASPTAHGTEAARSGSAGRSPTSRTAGPGPARQGGPGEQAAHSAPSPQILQDRLTLSYAAALAAMKLRDHAAAQAAWQQAQRDFEAGGAHDAQAARVLQLLGAELALARDEPAAALKLLDTLPGGAGRAGMLMRTTAATAWQRADGGEAAVRELRRSLESLQAWLVEHRRDASAWAALSGVASALGLPLRALRAQAEVHASRGDLNGAIDRFRAAQTAARGGLAGQDFIEASVIDSRLRELTAQRRQLLLELRGGREGPWQDDEQLPR